MPAPSRIRSIDIARGIVMVLMAIDHVRVFAAVPAGGATADLFLTRWVTNFCAPAFAFLAGASIFLYGQRRNDPSSLSRWLVVRGAWLVLLELTWLRLAWTFNFDYSHYMLAGVIWMLGWCMILMALLVRLPLAANAALGLLVIAGHNGLANAFAGSRQALLQSDLGWLWRILYFGGAAGPNFFVLYSIVPWIGVMAVGYSFGIVLRMDPERRDRLCYAIGVGPIAAFVVLRYFNIYGDWPWAGGEDGPAWMAFLNTSKYPASLLFLLMTLGPTIAVLPWFERWEGRFAKWMETFGRVPMFYYLLHIPLIHIMALGISLLRTPSATAWLFGNFPLRPPPAPAGYKWSLWLLYLVTTAVVVILYFACRWFAGLKSRRKSDWLSYL
jgi:uncharacterized membrane protein